MDILGERVPDLVDYGIQTEESDYRIHVCFGEGYIYVFQTAEGIEACKSGRYRCVAAHQPGVNYRTAEGYLVPPDDLSTCQRIRIPSDILIHCRCIRKASTSAKGRAAIQTVKAMTVRGLVPVPILADEVTEEDMQVKGVDILMVANVRMQVKCDYDGGISGTGNLYLQVRELNPLGLH